MILMSRSEKHGEGCEAACAHSQPFSAQADGATSFAARLRMAKEVICRCQGESPLLEEVDAELD
jgi:hypothetical protein